MMPHEISNILITVLTAVVSALAVAAFLRRNQADKGDSAQQGSAGNGSGSVAGAAGSTADTALIEQAAIAASLQEQLDNLRREYDELNAQLDTVREAAHNEKITLVKDLSNCQTETGNLKQQIANHENELKKVQLDHQMAIKKEQEQAARLIEESSNRYEASISEIKSANERLLINLKNANQEALNKLEQENTSLKEALKKAQEEIMERSEALAQTRSEKEAVEQLRVEDSKRFAQSQSELEHRLNTMGEKLLKDRSESLQKLNSEHMVQIINPLQNELNTFRTLIAATQKTNSEQAGQLQNELKHLHEAQISLGEKAENLSRALLQGSKSQGIWGEQQLALVLDASGLNGEENYVREAYAVNDQGDKGRADVLIRLPQGRGLIIDSKCSLTAYTELCNAEKENDRKACEAALSRHIDSIRKHIDELSKKDYPGYDSYGSPGFVFMFVPVDHALGTALRHDDRLYGYAQSKNVYLVSPSSLLPALRIVGNLWVLANQGDKFRMLARSAERIYQKCSKVCNDFEAILKIRDSLNKNIDAMAVSLCTGQGNLKNILQKFAADAPALTMEAVESFERALNADSAPATAASAAAAGSGSATGALLIERTPATAAATATATAAQPVSAALPAAQDSKSSADDQAQLSPAEADSQSDSSDATSSSAAAAAPAVPAAESDGDSSESADDVNEAAAIASEIVSDAAQDSDEPAPARSRSRSTARTGRTRTTKPRTARKSTFTQSELLDSEAESDILD